MKDVQTHLDNIESETIEIIRDVMSEADNPLIIHDIYAINS